MIENLAAYAACIGLDWSSKEHVLCIHDNATGRESIRKVSDEPEALLVFLAELRELYSNRPVLLGLEATRASILPILLQQDFLCLVLINPKTSGQFRGMFRVSGVKSDAVDATYICRLIRTHPEELRLWKPHDPHTRHLAALAEKRRNLVTLRVEVANKLHAAVAASSPQLLRLLKCQLTVPMASQFLKRWPTLPQAQAAGVAKLRAFFYKNNVRTSATIEQRLHAMAQSKPLLISEQDTLPFELEIQALAEQLCHLHRAIDRFETALHKSYQEHPVAKILAEVPGAGPQLKPRLAACLGTHKDRFASAQELSCYTGIAPVHDTSGNSQRIMARRVRPLFLHQTWIEFANCSIRKPGWARSFYEAKSQEKLKHYEAIRALAFKWQRILFACWKSDQPYDQAKHLPNLQRKNPKLYAAIEAAAAAVNK